METIEKILDYITENENSELNIDSNMIEYLVGSLSENELNELLLLLKKKEYGLLYRARFEANRCLGYYDYKHQCDKDCLKRNEPVKTLLALYNNKRSGRRQEARKKLQQRFMHLSYKEQCLCMKTFLYGGKTDREWCYSTLRRWWTEEIHDDIIHVWNAYHEEHCGWLFPRHMSVDILKEYIDSLIYDSNYYAMCDRLVDEDWFEIDKIRLLKLTDECRYLWVMSRTKAMLSPYEAVEQIYRWIARCIIKYDYETYSDGISLSWRYENPIVELYETDSIGSRLFMEKITSMNKILSSLCRMRMYDEVEKFHELDREIHNSFVKSYEKDISDADKFSTMRTSKVVEELYMKFVQYYALHIPRKYMYCLKLVNPVTPPEVYDSIVTSLPLSQEQIDEICSTPSMEFLMDNLNLEVDEDQCPF